MEAGGLPIVAVPAHATRNADAAAVAAAIRRDLGPALVRFLPSRRWYGDKAREIAAVSLVDAAVDDDGPPWFVLAIAEVAFADGSPPATYLLPLATALAGTADAVAHLDVDGKPHTLVDAFADPSFPARLLRRLSQNAHLPGDHGNFVWEAFPAMAGLVVAADSSPTRLIGTDSSNSSVRFGDILFLKIVRRLRPGINPDEEIGRFLAEQTDFRHAPAPLGAGHYLDAGGITSPFALAQRFVAATADGWDFLLAALIAPVAKVDETAVISPLHLLGKRTGELHVALATPTDDTAFATEAITETDCADWEATTIATLRETTADLIARGNSFPPATRALAERLARQVPELSRRATGFNTLLGTVKSRVHGDYHLGQTLRTPDDDWVILDFEGEPARSITERRAKTSPFKDVAGMLRSFGYLRAAAQRALGDQISSGLEYRLAKWESGARRAFLVGYREAVSTHPAMAWVVESRRFAAAIAAWELDKALYEVAYESNNRPDWLDLPLRSLLQEDHS